MPACHFDRKLHPFHTPEVMKNKLYPCLRKRNNSIFPPQTLHSERGEKIDVPVLQIRMIGNKHIQNTFACPTLKYRERMEQGSPPLNACTYIQPQKNPEAFSKRMAAICQVAIFTGLGTLFAEMFAQRLQAGWAAQRFYSSPLTTQSNSLKPARFYIVNGEMPTEGLSGERLSLCCTH